MCHHECTDVLWLSECHEFVIAKVTTENPTPHVARKKMLKAMLDRNASLTDAEMEHLLACKQCMDLLGDLVLPDE